MQLSSIVPTGACLLTLDSSAHHFCGTRGKCVGDARLHKRGVSGTVSREFATAARRGRPRRAAVFGPFRPAILTLPCARRQHVLCCADNWQ